MPQTSGPLTDQTFTDAEWRETIGDEAGIRADINGTSYTLTLPTSSDIATLGSATQDSIAVVGGFRHKILAGQTQETVAITAPTGAARTDLIGLMYDPTWGATDPGPVRVHRIAGTEGAGTPTYDGSQPGVEFMPLWSVTRSVGQALSQANREDLRVRTGPNLYVNDDTDLPSSVPIGTRVYVRSTAAQYFRVLDAQQSPVWTQGRVDDVSGAHSGTAPPAGQATYSKHRVGNLATNGSGDTTVTFPGGAFPRGVVSVHLDVVVPGGAQPFVWSIGAVTNGQVNARAYNLLTGAPGANLSIGSSLTVTGW